MDLDAAAAAVPAAAGALAAYGGAYAGHAGLADDSDLQQRNAVQNAYPTINVKVRDDFQR